MIKSMTDIKTFLPQIFLDKQRNMVYIDIVGYCQNSMIELMSMFIAKQLFDNVKNVKFMMTLTANQIKEEK